MGTCKWCGRGIRQDADGTWVDPEATGDDSVWREACDSHDTFTAEHEPYSADDGPCIVCGAYSGDHDDGCMVAPTA